VKRTFLASALMLVYFLLMTLNAYAVQKYTVKKGDNLSKIAKKFKVDRESILNINNLDSATLKPGTRLTIPSVKTLETKHSPKRAKSENTRVAEKANGIAASYTATERTSAQDAKYHVVTKGDTLTSLAKKYSLSMSDIKDLNNLGKSTRLRPGQRLLVKKSGPKTYIVKKGDTLRKVAKKFDMSSEDLLELNELESDELKPGQKLVLEEWSEQPDADTQAVQSQAKISEDIKILAESPELNSLSMKDRLILFAKKMLDIPYRFGGSTFMGIDCSGYVQKVFGLLDVSLPRTAREQFHLGEPVTKEDLSMGDLVFFRTYASFPSHVGIYLGNNLFIHASSKNRKVSIDSLDTPYYVRRFIGAKRLFPEELDTARDSKDNS